MRAAIEHYFGGNVEGFNTYKYYQENNILRSWICIPLTMGIYDRAGETVKVDSTAALSLKDCLASVPPDYRPSNLRPAFPKRGAA